MIPGGDEARVARAGSGRGESSFANGTPSSRALPPRAGWAVRQTTAVSTSPLLPSSATASFSTPPPRNNSQITRTNSSASSSSSCLGQWTNENHSRSVLRTTPPSRPQQSSTNNIITTVTPASPPTASFPTTPSTNPHATNNLLHQQRHQNHNVDRIPQISQNRWPERLELRGVVVPMSQNASPPSRPPSSASSVSSSTSPANLARVHATGHDHTRPLPPPRLPEITTISSSSISNISLAPLTAPLTPLSTTASFRNNNNTRPLNSGITITTATTTTAPSTTSPNHVHQNNIESSSSSSSSSSNLPGILNASSVNTTNSTITSSSRTTTNLDNSRSNLGEVTLTVPRPDVERAVNEYVETPFRQTQPQPTNVNSNHSTPNQKCLKSERRHHHHHHHHHRHQQQLRHSHNQQNQQSTAQSKSLTAAATTALVGAQARNNDNNSGSMRRHQSHLLQSSLTATSQAAVTKQPVSFTKEPANALGSGTILGGRLNDPSLSIMCDSCGRCRCESCREPPPLPSRWLCNNSCFCSAETVIDYASCLCCVKGLFYHCADSGSGTDAEAGGNCADEPCSCVGPRRIARWACLGALTLVLPCLVCYWPLRGCATGCEKCYATHAAQGCRCDPNSRHHPVGAPSVVSRDSRDPEKRLLDPVTPEL